MQARRQTKERTGSCSSHHIDDPLWNNDNFPRRLAAQGPLDSVEGEDGGLNIDVSGVARNGYVRTLFAVHLHRQRDRILNEEVVFNRWPALIGKQGCMAQRRPTFLGQMRHHWVK